MNEQFELVGVIGTEQFTRIEQVWDGKNVHQHMTTERVVPMLFKDLPPGTQLFMKKVEQ